MMTFFNTALQLYRVMTGAQQMTETMTDSERTVVVLVTRVLLPIVLGPLIYYSFVWAASLMEKLGDIFFPEEGRSTKNIKSAATKQKPANNTYLGSKPKSQKAE